MKYKFNILEGVDIITLSSEYDAICVTTNAIINNYGELVMGAGVAKHFANKFPEIKRVLGCKVSEYGNYVFEAKVIEVNNHKCTVLSFPTKNHYKDKADIDLIKASAKRLVEWANSNNATKIAIPSPGTGLGGLSKELVYAELNNILDNRFTITLFK